MMMITNKKIILTPSKKVRVNYTSLPSKMLELHSPPLKIYTFSLKK